MAPLSLNARESAIIAAVIQEQLAIPGGLKVNFKSIMDRCGLVSEIAAQSAWARLRVKLMNASCTTSAPTSPSKASKGATKAKVGVLSNDEGVGSVDGVVDSSGGGVKPATKKRGRKINGDTNGERPKKRARKGGKAEVVEEQGEDEDVLIKVEGGVEEEIGEEEGQQAV